MLGDARLTLADALEACFDLLILDAFSSDSIPVHLLTQEALTLYLKRLKPEGVLAMHLSNRHLDLESVAAALFDDLGLASRFRDDTLDESRAAGHSASNGPLFPTQKQVLPALNTTRDGVPLLQNAKFNPGPTHAPVSFRSSNYLTMIHDVASRMREESRQHCHGVNETSGSC